MVVSYTKFHTTVLVNGSVA